MSRIWHARKISTFVPAAVAGGASPPYALGRAGPELAAAVKQALRLVTAYTLLLLPLHVFVSYLAAQSPGLAVPLILVAAAALLTVALARWLGLDDLLQKLPLLAVLVLVGVGLLFFSSPVAQRGLTGGDFFGGLFLLIMVVSVLGSLYKPLAVTYQAVTTKTPFPELCVAAAALLGSLALAAVAHAVPQFVLAHYALGVCGFYAGLVVTEYAAWARANPAVGLARRIKFEAASPQRKKPDARGAILGAAIFGGSFGVLKAVTENLRSPSPEFIRSVVSLCGSPEQGLDVLAAMLFLGVVGLVFGFLKTGYSLGTAVPGNPLAAARFAGQALVVFLTYPDVTHPLVHQFHTRWLRTRAVRAALTCAALVTVATALFPRADQPRQPATAEKSAPAVPTPTLSRREIPQGDLDLARISGQPVELWLGPEFAPVPATPPAAPGPAMKPDGEGAMSLLSCVLGLVLLPPLILATMVFYVGLHVLPAYGSYFETPAPTN